MKGPRVLAVSSSQPRWIDMNGVKVWTSLVRDESPVPLHFGEEGPEGNALALHTEKIYAFPQENYAYWGGKLGLDHSQWPACFWGENLMVEGLSEESVRVGDLLTFSGGAVLEVTGPRTPCSKMTWRLGVAGTVLKRLTSDGLLGFYLRTVRGAFIGKGENITLSSPYPDNLTVAELGRLLDRGASGDPERLKFALDMPRLSDQTVEQLLHTLVHIGDVQRSQNGRWKGWRPFVITQARHEATGVRSVTLVPQDGAAATFRAGQFVTVRIPVADDFAIRTWSLSDYSELDPTNYRLTVKKIDDGIGSSWLHGVQLGATVELRPPAGQFVIERSGLRPVVLISAGIGITPLLAMLKAHAAGFRPTPLTWIHSTRSSATHILRQEADAILASSPLFTRQVHYTHPAPCDQMGSDYDLQGRLSPHQLENLVSRPSRYILTNREIELNGITREFFICGPRDFEKEVIDTLKALGVSDHLIKCENFLKSDIELLSLAGPSEASVQFQQSRRTSTWQASEHGSLLDLAESLGIELDFGCRSGTCGACQANLVEGAVDYPFRPKADIPPGKVLLCCARPVTNCVVIDA